MWNFTGQILSVTLFFNYGPACRRQPINPRIFGNRWCMLQPMCPLILGCLFCWSRPWTPSQTPPKSPCTPRGLLQCSLCSHWLGGIPQWRHFGTPHVIQDNTDCKSRANFSAVPAGSVRTHALFSCEIAMAQKMAAANPLEELFNKDVDETALSALVGSLESQLASPTLKDPPQHSSAGAVHSNHVDAARVGDAISQHSQVLSQAGQKAGLVHNNAQISVNTVNGRKDSISQSQLINLNSVASSSPGLNNSTSGVSLQQRSHQGSPLTSAAHATSGNVVSSNVTNSTIPQTQINSNASQPPHLNSDHRTVVTIPGSTNTGTIVSGVPAPGHPSQVGGSAIYNLASVAAEQSPISISNHNSNNQSHIVTGARTTVREQLESKGQNDGVSVNMVNASNFNNKSQFIVKQDNIKPNSPQPIGVSNQQTINIVTGSKAAGTPPPASGGTVNKPVGNPQVTVVRPPTSNIQIVSVNSNNPRQPNSVGLPSHKTLAPRIVSAAPVRIGQPPASATQQTTQVMTAVPRPQGAVSINWRC